MKCDHLPDLEELDRYKHDEREEEERLDLDGDEEEAGYCPSCSGSGEGQYEGYTCHACKGSGVQR